MATTDELSLPVRLFLKTYSWRRVDPVPWAPLAKPLAESRLALVSSAGFVLPGQERFKTNLAGGDGSFREIPASVDVAALTDAHKSESFDHQGTGAAPNLPF